jgi:uncharacterized protein YndB with AHSA1/START domain
MRIECATIVGEIEIEAPPEAVFDALVTPEDLAAWWGWSLLLDGSRLGLTGSRMPSACCGRPELQPHR